MSWLGAYTLHPSTEKLLDICSEGAAALVGCVFIAIGLSSMTDNSIHPIDSISFLTHATPLGSVFDWYFWAALTINGVWLVLCYAVRLAAICALGLILLKWLIFLFAD